jgi:hypothetical protein
MRGCSLHPRISYATGGKDYEADPTFPANLLAQAAVSEAHLLHETDTTEVVKPG